MRNKNKVFECSDAKVKIFIPGIKKEYFVYD